MEIIGKIENFDPNKSYHKKQFNKRLIPIYPDPSQCSCQYGYDCDDPNFDYSKPIRYEEASSQEDYDSNEEYHV